MSDWVGRQEPGSREHITWPSGAVLEVATYVGTASLPDPDIRSVRCIVQVDGSVVVCQTPNELHVMPGGRRLPGESHVDTAVREVHEETGWLLDPSSVCPVGFLHFTVVEPGAAIFAQRQFLQLVLTGGVRGHETGDPASWRDTEGWEQGTFLTPLGELGQLPLTAGERTLLRTLAAQQF